MKYIIILLTSLLFLSCTGTGYKNYSDIAPQIDNLKKTKIFLYRDMGLAGSVLLLRLNLNGLDIGELSEGQMMVAKGKIGRNEIYADMDGLLGRYVPYKKFEIKEEENKYFIINLTNEIPEKIEFIETQKNDWIKAASD